ASPTRPSSDRQQPADRPVPPFDSHFGSIVSARTHARARLVRTSRASMNLFSADYRKAVIHLLGRRTTHTTSALNGQDAWRQQPARSANSGVRKRRLRHAPAKPVALGTLLPVRPAFQSTGDTALTTRSAKPS